MSYSPKNRLLKLGYTEQLMINIINNHAEWKKHPPVFYQLRDKLIEIRDAYYVHRSAIGMKLGINRRVEFEKWKEL